MNKQRNKKYILDFDSQALVNFLREYRHEFGLKQKVMARHLEISSVHMNRLEKHRQQMSIEQIKAMADKLGLDIEIIFKERG